MSTKVFEVSPWVVDDTNLKLSYQTTVFYDNLTGEYTKEVMARKLFGNNKIKYYVVSREKVQPKSVVSFTWKTINE